jgi:hypothetical protein
MFISDRLSRRLVVVLTLLAGGIALAGLLGSGRAAPVAAQTGPPVAAPTPCGGAYTWNQVASPNPSTQNFLYGTAVLSPSDAWAVGFTWSGYGSYETLALDWNGTTWTRVASPNPGYDPVLHGVAAVAANDVWAVGDANYQPIIEHWNGSTWAEVPVPALGGDYVRLYSIAAVAANDVWAVGRRFGSIYATVVLHWDGTAWSESLSGRIAGPNGYPTGFYGVTALAANDIWAVGTIFDNGDQTLTAHWNGTTWTRVASPNPSTSENYLRSVTALAPNDVWAVGYYGGAGARSHTLTLHWTGTQWLVVPSPDPEPPGGPARVGHAGQVPDGGGGDICRSTTCVGNFLFGVAAAAPDEIWAVGSTDSFTENTYTLILRWDGSAWTQVPSTDPSPLLYNRLYAVATAAPGDAWAVGAEWQAVGPYDMFNTLIEHYNSAYCPSPTPAPPTNTPTACPTGTPAWTVIPSANGPSVHNDLYAVGVVAPNDIWAVGEYYTCYGCGNGAFILHWDGMAWTLVPNTIPGILRSIAVIGPDDIWAVGSGTNGPVTAHWDGSRWTNVANGICCGDTRLWGVAAVASNDVWAVGELEWEQGPLVLHWNGTAWTQAALPQAPGAAGNAPGYSVATHLEAVTALAHDNVWAVGTLRFNNSNRTLTYHWDGTTWNIVSSPSPGTYSNMLVAVAAAGPNDVWAVGFWRNAYEDPQRTLTLHWNGAQWSLVSSPNPTATSGNGASRPTLAAPAYDYDGDLLTGVTAVSAEEVWAVGYIGASGTAHSRTLVLRWDGSTWSQVDSPNPGTPYVDALRAVAAVGPSHIWAVGLTGSGTEDHSLTIRYGPACDATPVPTSTTIPATRTPVPPTRTPVPSPTQTPVIPTPTPPICGQTQPLVDDFEHAGTIGTNFISTVATCVPGACGWRAAVDSAHSGVYSAFVPDRVDVTDQQLTTANAVPIVGDATSATLTFWHRQQIDVGGDGGVLEVSTDDGATWTDADTNITSGGYDGPIGGVQNPLRGRRGWTHYDYGTAYRSVTVNLLPYAGHELLFRFRFGSDNSIGSVGWWVDDVTVTVQEACVTATGTVPSATPTATIPSGCALAVASFHACADGQGCVDYSIPLQNTGDAPLTLAGSAVLQARGGREVGRATIAPTTISPHSSVTTSGTVCGAGNPDDGPFQLLITLQDPMSLCAVQTLRAPLTACAQIPAPPTFSDVPPSHPFAAYIHWLAAYGYVSGYRCGGTGEPCDAQADPYFRSSNTVTRGQLMKMIVNASHWSMEGQETATFADVPATHPFYPYIEAGARQGLISGYGCGGPGEPCDAARRPYFRPATPITRGQLSKVLALAWGFALPLPATPTFADVPTTNPFYGPIEAMAAYGFVTGYGCGGPGEPCDAGRRPYFRAGGNATRGQVTKFVTLAYGGP